MINEKLNISNIHFVLKDYNVYLHVLKNYAKNTIKVYLYYVDEFVFFLQKNKYYHFSQIDKNTFYKYISFVRHKNTRKKITNKTINLRVAAINNFSDFLCKTHCFCELKKIKQLKYLSKIPNMLDEYEMLNLFKSRNPIFNEKANWISYRDYALAVTIYSSGARVSEAINMIPIDIEDIWVRLDKTKNKTTRFVPTNHHMHDSINNYKEECPFSIYKYLWVCRMGNQLKMNAASVAIKKMFGYSPHYFRHAFATHLILNKCDLRTVQEFLGHSSLATTSIYTHIKPKHLKETVNRCHPLSDDFEH